MPHPKHRATSSATGRRRSHLSLEPMQLSNCQKCKAVTMPHCACASCGTYAGRQVIAMEDPIATTTKKKAVTKTAKTEKAEAAQK